MKLLNLMPSGILLISITIFINFKPSSFPVNQRRSFCDRWPEYIIADIEIKYSRLSSPPSQQDREQD
jgi:hypothetical protein